MTLLNTSFHRQKAAENEIRKHATVRSKGDNNMKVPLDFPGGKGEVGDKGKPGMKDFSGGRGVSRNKGPIGDKGPSCNKGLLNLCHLKVLYCRTVLCHQ
jgi:hypothetical protein